MEMLLALGFATEAQRAQFVVGQPWSILPVGFARHTVTAVNLAAKTGVRGLGQLPKVTEGVAVSSTAHRHQGARDEGKLQPTPSFPAPKIFRGLTPSQVSQQAKSVESSASINQATMPSTESIPARGAGGSSTSADSAVADLATRLRRLSNQDLVDMFQALPAAQFARLRQAAPRILTGFPAVPAALSITTR